MSVKIHHLAAISGDLQRTISFYANILGAQFQLKHSLFDGPKVCHFYWEKDLSSFITFYHCPYLRRGVVGFNSVCSVSFSVSSHGFEFWKERLQLFGIPFSITRDGIDDTYALVFYDTDGLQLKLVFDDTDHRIGSANACINENNAIKGIFSIEILVPEVTNLKKLFTEQCNLTVQPGFDDGCRLSNLQKPGTKIDLLTDTTKGKTLNGCGLVHHIALKVPSWKHFMGLHHYMQIQRQNIISPTRQRDYATFYFKEEGGLLVEIVWHRPFVNCSQTRWEGDLAFSSSL